MGCELVSLGGECIFLYTAVRKILILITVPKVVNNRLRKRLFAEKMFVSMQTSCESHSRLMLAKIFKDNREMYQSIAQFGIIEIIIVECVFSRHLSH